MRQYQPIWEQIKVHKTAVIVAPSFLHARIIQAVMKERSLDLPFRKLLQKHHIKMELIKKVDEKKDTITFKLVEAKGIKVTDL